MIKNVKKVEKNVAELKTISTLEGKKEWKISKVGKKTMKLNFRILIAQIVMDSTDTCTE